MGEEEPFVKVGPFASSVIRRATYPSTARPSGEL
jgi:hypothetical protein